jgi:uridine kinase
MPWHQLRVNGEVDFNVVFGEIEASVYQARSRGKRTVVYVCGLGGAGKTVFTDNLRQRLAVDSVVMRHDWYSTYSTKQRRERIRQAIASRESKRIAAEENPRNWYRDPAFLTDLITLRNTGSLRTSDVWNQDTGERDSTVELSVANGGIILVDGIYLLHEPVAELADLRILLRIMPETGRQRADRRDSHRSDQAYLEYKRQLTNRYDRPYFEHHQTRADIVVDNDDYEKPVIIARWTGRRQ